MTEPRIPDMKTVGYNPAHRGCLVCGTQETVSLDGRHGRRCVEHLPDVTNCDCGWCE